MRRLLLALAFCSLANVVHGEDAPQFRGPGGLGISKETGLPLTWNEKDNIRWKQALPGRGLSAPVIAGGRVFVTACSAFEQKRLHLLCFDARTGARLWERQLWATGVTLCHPKTNMAAPTPATDGTHVFALFATGDLACFDRDGNLQWYRSLVGDYPTIGNNVGMASSPILWQDVVIVNLQNVGESFVGAVDKRTGENRWRVKLPAAINWVTPLVIDNAGQPEVIVHGGFGLLALDPASGKKKWEIAERGFSTIPSATFSGGIVFAPGGKFAAVKPGNARSKPEILWESAKLSSGYCSPIVHEGRVYALSSGGVLNCADAATGKHLWNLRVEGDYAASPLLAEGKLYLVNEKGMTTIVDPNAEDKILATNVLDGSILASPVASGSALFLRSDQSLWCIGKTK